MYVRILFLILFCLLQHQSKAQYLAAFENEQKFFYVFDNGNITRIEFNQVKNYTVGGNWIAYTDFQNRLKLYYKGKVFDLQDVSPGVIQSTDYLLAYSFFKQMRILWDDKISSFETWAYDPSIVDIS